jgi:hypothetical protein
MRVDEGIEAFRLPIFIRVNRAKATRIPAPHSITIFEAVKYYEKHVFAYKTAAQVKELVQHFVDDCPSRNLRPRTISDLKHRLSTFALDFGESSLSDITLDELKEWVRVTEPFLQSTSMAWGGLRTCIVSQQAQPTATEPVRKPD